jgi:hypothetical protein
MAYTRREQFENLTRQDDRGRSRSPFTAPAEPSVVHGAPVDEVFEIFKQDALINAGILLKRYREFIPPSFMKKLDLLAIKFAALKHSIQKVGKQTTDITTLTIETSKLPAHMKAQQKYIDSLTDFERKKNFFDGFVATEAARIKSRLEEFQAKFNASNLELDELVALFTANNPSFEQSTLNWEDVFNALLDEHFSAMAVKMHYDTLKKEKKKEDFAASKEQANTPVVISAKEWTKMQNQLKQLEKQVKQAKSRPKNEKGGPKNPGPPRTADGQKTKRKTNGKKKGTAVNK